MTEKEIILFDLDGTLTDPKIGITRSVQYALEAIGRPEPDIEKLLPFIGPPLKEQFMSYCQIDEEKAKFCVEKYRERFSVTGIFENQIYEGIAGMLTSLREAQKTLAVATSKPWIFAEKILEHFEIKDFFDVIVGSEMDGRRTKKSEVIEEAFIRLKADETARESAVMIGDRRHDIEGAKQAGIASVGVTFGYGGYAELEQAGADKIVCSVEELKQLLTGRK